MDKLMTSEREAADDCIILFVKSPEHVPVKSRLAASIGEEMARNLYRNFVLDILETLSGVTAKTGWTLKVCFYPPDALPEMRNWLGKDYRYLSQQGKDLGERMKNAFLAIFAAGYRGAILLGSDTPDLTGEIITEGFNRLEHSGAVIGPAHDGGYYLIGFQYNAFQPKVFEGLPWGTGSVFAGTMEIFRRLKADVSVLPLWRDIDTLTDLRELREQHQNSSFADSRTMRSLMSWNEELVKSRKHG